MKISTQKFLLLTVASTISFNALAVKNRGLDIGLEDASNPTTMFSPTNRGGTSGVTPRSPTSPELLSPTSDEGYLSGDSASPPDVFSPVERSGTSYVTPFSPTSPERLSPPSNAGYLAAQKSGFVSIAALEGLSQDASGSNSRTDSPDSDLGIDTQALDRAPPALPPIVLDDEESNTSSTTVTPKFTDEDCVEDALKPTFWASITAKQPEVLPTVLQILNRIQDEALAELKGDQRLFSDLIWDIAKRIHKNRVDAATQLDQQIAQIHAHAETHLQKKLGFPSSWHALMAEIDTVFQEAIFQSPPAQPGPDGVVVEEEVDNGVYTAPHPMRSRGHLVSLHGELLQRLTRARANVPNPADPLQKLLRRAEQCLDGMRKAFMETQPMADQENALIRTANEAKNAFPMPASSTPGVNFLQELRVRALHARNGDMQAFWGLFNDAALAQWLSYSVVTTPDEFDAFHNLKQVCIDSSQWHFETTQALAMSNPNVWMAQLAQMPEKPTSPDSDRFGDSGSDRTSVGDSEEGNTEDVDGFTHPQN